MNRFISAFCALLTLLLVGWLAVLPTTPHHNLSKPKKPVKTAWELASRKSVGLGPLSAPGEWFWNARAFPHGMIDDAAFLRASRDAQTANARAVDEVDETWNLAGPTNRGGRITALAWDPRSNIGPIYAGAAFGGIWKSSGVWGELTWSQIFGNAGSLSIGAIAIPQQTPDTIYVGTGEANGAIDTYAGDGFWMSPDGGQTWQHRGLDSSAHIGKIAVHPNQPATLYVAVVGKRFATNADRGLYKSTNAGHSWTRVLAGLNDTTGCSDVAIHPTRPDTVYAAMWQRIRAPQASKFYGIGSTLMRSTNGGTSWTEILPTSLRGRQLCRLGVTTTRAQANYVYLSVVDSTLGLNSVWRSTNAGNTWAQLSTISTGINSNFGWYFGSVACDPRRAGTLYVHGVQTAISTNSGAAFTNASGSIYQDVHVDYHAIAFAPTGGRQVWGNDGGVYLLDTLDMSGSGAAQFVNDVPIMQFYAITSDYQNPNRLYGGTQDNGTNCTLTGGLSDWLHIYGGDGFYCLVDPRYADSVYCEYQYGGLGKGSPVTTWFEDATNGIDGTDRRNWSTPVIMSPQNPNVMYYGTYRVYKTTDASHNWSAISTDLTGGVSPNNARYPTISTIGVSPCDSNIVWAGTENGKVWVTTNGGTSWNDVSSGLPLRYLTRIVCAPDTAAIAYVTLSGFRWSETNSLLYRTTDFGVTWQSIGEGLPDAPLNCIVIDPLHSSDLYVASDVGVHRSTDLGASWSSVAQGHPVVSVYDLNLHPVSRRLVSGTHGYSMWSVYIDSIRTDVKENFDVTQPSEFTLSKAFPSPFNNRVSIRINASQYAHYQASVYDLLGREVAVIHNGPLSPGSHLLHWSPQTESSGTYWLKVSNGRSEKLQRLVYLK